MACATTRPTFSFHHSSSAPPPSSPKTTTTAYFLPIPAKRISRKSTISLKHLLRTATSSNLIPKSIDVSKEDKPTTAENTTLPAAAAAEEEQVEEKGGINPPTTDSGGDYDLDSSSSSSSSLSGGLSRREERFAVLNTGIHECRSCGYQYNEAAGDPSYPVPPGLPFSKLPEDWRCATCGAAKSLFVSKSVEIAGFAENQQFGLGGNTLTSGQKAVLIYGSLLLGFIFFLSGYFLE